MKNQFNFIVLSIIVSDFFISSIGVTLDLIGAILQGSTLANWLCYFEGPVHTSFGNILIYIYNIYYLLWKTKVGHLGKGIHVGMSNRGFMYPSKNLLDGQVQNLEVA